MINIVIILLGVSAINGRVFIYVKRNPFKIVNDLQEALDKDEEQFERNSERYTFVNDFNNDDDENVSEVFDKIDKRYYFKHKKYNKTVDKVNDVNHYLQKNKLRIFKSEDYFEGNKINDVLNISSKPYFNNKNKLDIVINDENQFTSTLELNTSKSENEECSTKRSHELNTFEEDHKKKRISQSDLNPADISSDNNNSSEVIKKRTSIFIIRRSILKDTKDIKDLKVSTMPPLKKYRRVPEIMKSNMFMKVIKRSIHPKEKNDVQTYQVFRKKIEYFRKKTECGTETSTKKINNPKSDDNDEDDVDEYNDYENNVKPIDLKYFSKYNNESEKNKKNGKCDMQESEDEECSTTSSLQD